MDEPNMRPITIPFNMSSNVNMLIQIFEVVEV